MTSGLKTTKPSREVLGLLLPGTQKYPTQFWSSETTQALYLNPGLPWGKTVLSEEMTHFLSPPMAQAETLPHQCNSLFTKE